MNAHERLGTESRFELRTRSLKRVGKDAYVRVIAGRLLSRSAELFPGEFEWTRASKTVLHTKRPKNEGALSHLHTIAQDDVIGFKDSSRLALGVRYTEMDVAWDYKIGEDT